MNKVIELFVAPLLYGLSKILLLIAYPVRAVLTLAVMTYGLAIGYFFVSAPGAQALALFVFMPVLLLVKLSME